MAYSLRAPSDVPVSHYLEHANSDWDDGLTPAMPSEFYGLDPHNVVTRRLIWAAGVKAGRQLERRQVVRSRRLTVPRWLKHDLKVLRDLIGPPNWPVIGSLVFCLAFWGGLACLLWRL